MTTKPNRIALITGGTRGIGAACARQLFDSGVRPVVVDVDHERLKAFCEETGFAGYAMDVSDYDDVSTVCKKIEMEVGKVDILVNNAGITRDGFLHKMDPVEQWETVINVNLTGVFNTTRVLSPGMRERGFGRIINISSMNGQRGQFGQSNYAAAKAGILGFTRSIAQELGSKGVTANAICPGFILTEMTSVMPQHILEQEVAKIPVGRIGEASDIARAVAFLASDAGGFVTGATLSVNGGQYMAA